ncbi:MAG: hypothetical protein ACXVEY_09730 [Actinomycetota bacterium]
MAQLRPAAGTAGWGVTLTKVEERVAIARPADEVYQLLTHEEPEWLLPFLRIAAHNGEQAGFELRARLRAQAKLRSEGPKTMVISLGNASVDVDAGVVEIPFHWEAAGYKSIFPLLDGRLLVKAIGEHTELVLQGEYRTPPPVSGDLDDTLVAHHAAQVAVRDLLSNLRTAMEDESSRKDLVEGSS